VSELRQAISAAGIKCDEFSGHSFRIGVATTAAAKGIEDSTIQTLGRWRSDNYHAYIRQDAAQLASFSRALVS
jgi:hypothetical protein